MQNATPPLFKQGISARVQLLFYALVSITCIVIDARVHLLDPSRSYLKSFLHPLESLMSIPFQAANTIETLLPADRKLLQEVQRLSKENEVLRIKNQQVNEILTQNKQLRELLDLRDSSLSQPIILTEITGAVGDRFSRNMLLDQGSQSGIQLGMAVLDSKGVLGQIARVYDNQSEVMPITSKQAQIPVQIKRTGLRTIAEGLGHTDDLRVLYIQPDADVQEGDEVITSGIDGVYPSQSPVGIIHSITRVSGENYLYITMKPASSLQHARFARVFTTGVQPLTATPQTSPRDKGYRQ